MVRENSPSAVPSSSMVTFVARFWRETSAGGLRWRGQIEHVQSRQALAFLDLQVMLRFMREFGIVMDHEPTSGDQVDSPVPSE